MKNRTFVFITAFLLVLASLSFAQEKKLRVIAQTTNIHADPDANSAVIEKVERGAVLTLLSTARVRNAWYFVSFYSTERRSTVLGFVQISAVEMVAEILKAPREEKRPPEKVEEVKFVSPRTVRVISEMANVRAEPNLESRTIRRIQSGVTLQSTAKAKEWYKVNLPPDKDGIVASGYIHQSLVQEVIEKALEVPKVEKKKPAVKPVPLPEAFPAKEFRAKARSGLAGMAGSASPVDKKYGPGLEFGGTLCLGVTRNVAVELGGFFLQTKTDGDPEGLSKGRLSIIPIQVGIQARFPVSSRFVPYLAGGGGFYLNRFTLDNEIADSWNALGFSIEEKIQNTPGYYAGAGVDFFFAGKVALSLSVKYCVAKTKGSWTLTDQVSGAETSGDLENLNLNSLFIGAGLKFCF